MSQLSISKNDQGMKKKISNILLVTAMLFASVTIAFVFKGCKMNDTVITTAKYPADVAYSWIEMQRKLLVGTPGILPHVAARTYAYMGLTMYESIVAGMQDYQSIVPQLSGAPVLPSKNETEQYYWPASTNAALAFTLKNHLPHTTPALMKAIDSLEAFYNNKFQAVADAQTLERSADFGRQIATAIFEWSKTDGGYEAYKSPFSENYVAPTSPGKWVSTGEFFAACLSLLGQ
jgi:hypothetical protein